jgi:hypothetical protein
MTFHVDYVECSKYIICYIGWQVLSYINIYIFNHQTKHWLVKSISLLNAILCVFGILYELYNKTIANVYSFYYYSLITFFIYDIENTSRFSIFWMHHILTICVIYIIQIHTDQQYIDHGRNAIFTFEMGNISIYMLNMMNCSVDKLYWLSYNRLKIFNVFTLLWYILWRCINPLFIIVKLPIIYGLILGIFTFASWVWSIKLYKSAIKSFYINPSKINNVLKK